MSWVYQKVVVGHISEVVVLTRSSDEKKYLYTVVVVRGNEKWFYYWDARNNEVVVWPGCTVNVQIRFLYFHFHRYFSRLFNVVLNHSLLYSASRRNRTPNRKCFLANHGNAKEEDAVLSGYITTLKNKQKLDVSSEGPSSRE
jgi:hypothetical protein